MAEPIAFDEAEDEQLLRQHLHLRPDQYMSSIRRPECQNVVGRTDLLTPVDQMKVMRSFRNVQFPKKNFPAVTVRFRPPRGTTVLSFRTGKNVICGCNSEEAVMLAAQNFRLMINSIGYRAGLTPIIYENKVYSYNIGFPIQVSEVEYEDEFGSIWSPTVFPGLVYKMYYPQIGMLVFESGAVMVTGVRRDEELTAALDHIIPILNRHRNLAYNPDKKSKSVARQLDRMARAPNERELQAKVMKVHGKKVLKEIYNLRSMRLSELKKIFDERMEQLAAEERARLEAEEKEAQLNGGGEQQKRGRKRKAKSVSVGKEDDEENVENIIQKEIAREEARMQAERKESQQREQLFDMPDLL